MKPLAVLLALSVLALSSCATVQKVDAAADVHALLIAIRDNDRAGFDRHVDKPALTRQLEARLIAEVRRAPLNQNAQMAAAVLAAPVARLTADALVRPSVFRAVAVLLGYSPNKPIPGALVISQALRPVGGDQVCAAENRSSPCLMTFTRQGEVWRLTAFNGDIGQLLRQP